LDEG
jgi:hypothetical protein